MRYLVRSRPAECALTRATRERPRGGRPPRGATSSRARMTEEPRAYLGRPKSGRFPARPLQRERACFAHAADAPPSSRVPQRGRVNQEDDAAYDRAPGRVQAGRQGVGLALRREPRCAGRAFLDALEQIKDDERPFLEAARSSVHRRLLEKEGCGRRRRLRTSPDRAASARAALRRGGRRAPARNYLVSPSCTSPRQAPVSLPRFSISCLIRSRSPYT
jgi:hypothetical protein